MFSSVLCSNSVVALTDLQTNQTNCSTIISVYVRTQTYEKVMKGSFTNNPEIRTWMSKDLHINTVMIPGFKDFYTMFRSHDHNSMIEMIHSLK